VQLDVDVHRRWVSAEELEDSRFLALEGADAEVLVSALAA
jgi:hypothetical protein